MPSLTDLSKRVLIGRALRSDRLGETLLPKRLALPVFASDALSSVAYAPQEILITLAVAGVGFYGRYAPWIALAVILLMATVVASYRQNVHAYPSGGGDYEVATVNFAPKAGLTVASALLVDYVLTVAVSVSSGVDNIAASVPFVAGHRAPVAIAIVVLLTLMNLRGVRESGAAFALPTYAFMVGVIGMVAYGLLRSVVLGDSLRSPSADYSVHVKATSAFTGFALVWLLMRAFSSGCAALTGVEAISNGVPAFQKPKSKNAATTLLLMGTLAVTMFAGTLALGLISKVHVVASPTEQLMNPDGSFVTGSYHQAPIIAQVAAAVFGRHTALFTYMTVVTALILVLAANTAFNGFPVLGSILAKDRFLPRQLLTRGDRLTYSNGVILLATFACLLIWVYKANVNALIPLYTIGVFVSFTLSQAGMVRHWTRLLRGEATAKDKSRWRRIRVINAVGFTFTGIVLVIVVVTKFFAGAYIVIIAMPILFALMTAIQRHYASVARELTPDDGDESMLPSRTHALVLVSKIHKPALRALNYARAARPSTLEAVTVNVDPDETAALQSEWDRRGLPIPLKVLDSPYREITATIVDYVRSLRLASPRDVVVVFIPEYVVGHWWEQLLHNQSALRLKGRLLFTPGVMVTSVPWQLHSSEGSDGLEERPAPGDVRRGSTVGGDSNG